MLRGRRSTWTDVRTAALEKLMRETTDRGVMAERLGVSVSSIHGKIAQIRRDHSAAAPKPAHGLRAPEVKAAPQRTIFNLPRRLPGESKPAWRPVRIERFAPLPDSRPTTFTHLAKGRCKWPVAASLSEVMSRELVCCGAPGEPYCETHDAMLHNHAETVFLDRRVVRPLAKRLASGRVA